MYKYWLVILIFIGCGAFAQQDKPLVQFSGVIYDVDSNSIVPYVNIRNISNNGKTYSANYKGYFSIVVKENDTLVFSSIGYKKLEIVIPKNVKENRFTAIIKMKSDNIQLPSVRVFPWASTDEFKRDFLTMKFPDDDLEIAKKNLSKKSLMELSATLPRDGSEYANINAYNNHIGLSNKGMIQTNPLLNPFAWGALINKIMQGNKSRKGD